MTNSRTEILPYRVWAWADAPAKYKALSEHGGDEDWVIVCPKGSAEDQVIWLVDRLAICDYSVSVLEDSIVYITAHS